VAVPHGAPYGLDRLEAVRRRGCDTWALPWYTSKRRTTRLTAATLADLLARLWAEMPPEERTRGGSGLLAPNTVGEARRPVP
jgi:hypothetical protein